MTIMAYSLDDWKMILATSALLICMVWDIAVSILKHYTRKVPSWIPSKLFTLNALSVFILANVDIEKGGALHPSDENYLQVMVNTQLRTDVARLTICVFVGCILPGLAKAGTEGGWSSLAALFVSLSFHVATEIYALYNNSNVGRKAGLWFVSSGVLLCLAASSLLLLSGTFMLASKEERCFHRYNLSELLSQEEEDEGDRWETLRIRLTKAWVAVLAWKTQLFGLNSLFNPGSGMIVTVCVAVMAVKVAYRSSLLHYNNGGGNLIFYLQCIFILLGWLVMLWRWAAAAMYCKNLFHRDQFFLVSYFFLVPPAIVGDVLCPTLLVSLLYSLGNESFTLKRFLISVFGFIALLPLFFLTLAASLMLLVCFICWYFSCLVFSSQFVQRLFRSDKRVSRKDECSKYQSILAGLGFDNEEKRTIFWRVNKNSFDRIKGSMDVNEQKCSRLLSMMGRIREAGNQRLRLRDPKKQPLWVEAVSRIFRDIADAKIGVDMKDAFAVYWEARDVLKFVDSPDNLIVDPFNIFANLNLKNFFDRLRCEVKIYNAGKKLKQGLSEHQEVNQERVNQLFGSLNRLGIEMFTSPLIGTGEEMFTSPLIGMGEEMVRIDERCYDNMEELSGKLCMMVGHVIVAGLLEAPDVLVKYAREWAGKFDEEKIERAMELAGKVSAVLLNVDIDSEERGG